MNVEDRLGILEARYKDLVVSFSKLMDEHVALKDKYDQIKLKVDWVHNFGGEL